MFHTKQDSLEQMLMVSMATQHFITELTPAHLSFNLV